MRITAKKIKIKASKEEACKIAEALSVCIINKVFEESASPSEHRISQNRFFTKCALELHMLKTLSNIINSEHLYEKAVDAIESQLNVV